MIALLFAAPPRIRVEDLGDLDEARQLIRTAPLQQLRRIRPEVNELLGVPQDAAVVAWLEEVRTRANEELERRGLRDGQDVIVVDADGQRYRSRVIGEPWPTSDLWYVRVEGSLGSGICVQRVRADDGSGASLPRYQEIQLVSSSR